MIRLIASIIEVTVTIIVELVGLCFEGIVSLIQQKRKTEYNADFVSAGTILSRSRGFCLNGRLSLSIKESYMNAIALGGSGSGKTTILLTTSALRMAQGNSSLIFNDPSHEIRKLVSGALLKLGYIIKILDYSDVKSECFNPLSRCKSISDIQKLTALLVRNSLGDSRGDPFWNKSAESLLSLFIRYLIFYAEPQYRTLYNVLQLVNVFAGSPKKIDKLIVNTRDEQLLNEYKAFVAYGDKTLMSVVATARAALSLFSDETIAKITSIDTIDFEEFRNKKVALFINNSVPDMHYYGALSSLFFQQFFNQLMIRIPDKSENNIFFLLDEASSMYLPSLSITISNIRKYNSGILLIYQDSHQLENIYGSYEAKNISANCYAKVYLPGQPIETCKMLETTLGVFQYKDDNEIIRTRYLMTADEIRMTDRAVILIGNKAPVHAKLFPYYNNWRLTKLTQIPAVETSNELPFDTIPIIPLSDNGKE